MKILISAAALALSLSTAAFAADHQVRIERGAFVPANLTVAAGDTITFTNLGPAPHTATAVNGSFDTGRLNKGQSARITVTGSGAIAYFCEIHPRMKGSVTAQ
ncbi:MAG: cupredoxin domain-containing protein [Pseudomonadota bacterium]